MRNGRNGRRCLMRVHKTAKNMSSDLRVLNFTRLLERQKNTLERNLSKTTLTLLTQPLVIFLWLLLSFVPRRLFIFLWLLLSFVHQLIFISDISLCRCTSASKNFKITTVIIPPITANTALRKISLLGNISVRFC